VLEPQRLGALEELHVLRVGPGVAPLDEVNAEPVQQARDLDLVLDREGEPLALGAVAERAVEELDVHGYRLFAASLGGKPQNLQQTPAVIRAG